MYCVLLKDVLHCTSCHEDSEDGYELINIEIDGQWQEVCCAVYEELIENEGSS